MSATTTKSFSSASASSNTGFRSAWGNGSVTNRNAALATTPSVPAASGTSGSGYAKSRPSTQQGSSSSSNSSGSRNPSGFSASKAKAPVSSSKVIPKVKLEIGVNDPEENAFVGDFMKYSEMAEDATGCITIPSNNVIQVKDIKAPGGLAMTEPELQAVGIWIVEQLEKHYNVELDKTPESIYANIPAKVGGEPIRHGQLHFKDVRVMDYMVKATMGEKREVEIKEKEEEKEEEGTVVPERFSSAWDSTEPVTWTSFMDNWADSVGDCKKYKTVWYEPWFPLITFVFPSDRVAAARATYMKENGLGPQDVEDVEERITGKLPLILGKSFAQIRSDNEGNVYDPYTLSAFFKIFSTDLPNSFYMKLLDTVHAHFSRYNYSKSIYHPDATKDSRDKKIYHEAVPLYPLCSFSGNGKTIFVQFAQGLSDAADARKLSTVMPYDIAYEDPKTGKMSSAKGVLVFKHALLNERKDEHDKIPHRYKYVSGFNFTGVGKRDEKSERRQYGNSTGRNIQHGDKKPYPKNVNKQGPPPKKDVFADVRSRRFNNEGEKSWRQPVAGAPRKSGFGTSTRSNVFGDLGEE